jgi:hypothetical protein
MVLEQFWSGDNLDQLIEGCCIDISKKVFGIRLMLRNDIESYFFLDKTILP